MPGQGADVSVELVGSPEALTRASLSTTTGSDSYAGSIIVMWVQQFDPESLGFVVNALLRGAFVEEMAAQAELSGRTVTVETARDGDARPGRQTMSITITLES
jgi:hypothetical protein